MPVRPTLQAGTAKTASLNLKSAAYTHHSCNICPRCYHGASSYHILALPHSTLPGHILALPHSTLPGIPSPGLGTETVRPAFQVIFHFPFVGHSALRVSGFCSASCRVARVSSWIPACVWVCMPLAYGWCTCVDHGGGESMRVCVCAGGWNHRGNRWQVLLRCYGRSGHGVDLGWG